MNRILKLFAFSLTATLTFSNLSAQEKENNPPAQNPPIIVEGLFGNRGMTYQMIINKKLQSIPKIGVFSVTNLVAEWESKPMTDAMTQTSLTYSLVKGLDVAAGFHYTPVTGIRPSAGLIYTYGTPEFLLVANPRIDLSKDAATELMVLSEYKPRINEQWSLYTRLQGLYGFTVDNSEHARSYVVLRAGVTYKEFSFGAGANFDWYGPIKHHETNIGAFISVPLF